MASTENHGQRPSRTSGRAPAGSGARQDPTTQAGQLPSEIFGFHVPYETGARGSVEFQAPTDVTVQAGQLTENVTGLTGMPITHTGAPGSAGATQHGGGETVHYTSMFGQLDGNGAQTARGHIDGDEDWTQFGDGYAGGPTLPVLQNARPTSTGVGGHARTHRVS